MGAFSQLMMSNKMKVEEMPLTAVGSPTVTDGVVSGFSSSNYLTMAHPFKLNSTTKVEFSFDITTGNIGSVNGIMATLNSYGLSFIINSSGALRLYMGDGSSWTLLDKTGTTVLSAHTAYNVKLRINKGVVTVLINNVVEFTANITIGTEYTYNLSIGVGRLASQYWQGGFNSNTSYLTIDGTKYNYQFAFVVSKIGSLTINNNVITGFSDNDYLQFPDISSFNSFEMKIKFKLTEDYSTARSLIGSGSYQQMAISPYNIRGLLRYNYNGSDTTDINLVSYSVTTDTDYFGIFRYDNNVSYVGISTDDITYTSNTKNISVGATILPPISSGIGTLKIGKGLTGGTIYLNECYIVVNAIKYKIIVE